MFDPKVNKKFYAKERGANMFTTLISLVNFRAGPALLRWYTLKLNAMLRQERERGRHYSGNIDCLSGEGKGESGNVSILNSTP